MVRWQVQRHSVVAAERLVRTFPVYEWSNDNDRPWDAVYRWRDIRNPWDGSGRASWTRVFQTRGLESLAGECEGACIEQFMM